MAQHHQSSKHTTPPAPAKIIDPLESAKQGAPPAPAAPASPAVKLSREEVIELAGKAAMQAEYVDGKTTGLGQAEFERVCREYGVEPPARPVVDEPSEPPPAGKPIAQQRVLEEKTVQLRGQTVVLRKGKVLGAEFLSQHETSIRAQGVKLELVPGKE